MKDGMTIQLMYNHQIISGYKKTKKEDYLNMDVNKQAINLKGFIECSEI